MIVRYFVNRAPRLLSLLFIRVRTILVLGYWVLGNIHRYWVVLLLAIFFVVLTPNTIPMREQSAPSTCQ